MPTENAERPEPERAPEPGLSTHDAVRSMLVLMPRVAQRLKRIAIPEALQSMSLAPRHLSLLAHLLFDGPSRVHELAARLQVAPTTVSLMVTDLSKQGVLERQADPADRRRTIVSLTSDPATRAAINDWLAKGADAWQQAFAPLTPAERALFVRTIETYERGTSDGAD